MRAHTVAVIALCFVGCGSDPFVGHWVLSAPLNVQIDPADGGAPGTESCTVQWPLDIRQASPGYDVGWFGCQLTATQATPTELSFVNGSCVIDGGPSLPGVNCPDGALAGPVCGWSTQIGSASRLTVVGSTLSFSGSVHGQSICDNNTFDFAPTNPLTGTRQ